MKNLPTKPIEKATIFYQGELAAGIRSHSFDLELFFDPNCISQENLLAYLEEMRVAIRDTYNILQGDMPSYVMFDFELEEQIKSENELAEETCYHCGNSPKNCDCEPLDAPRIKRC